MLHASLSTRCRRVGGRTVDGNGNAFEELETILAVKGRDLAQFADGKVFGDLWLLNNPELEVVRLRSGFDPDGSGMITL